MELGPHFPEDNLDPSTNDSNHLVAWMPALEEAALLVHRTTQPTAMGAHRPTMLDVATLSPSNRFSIVDVAVVDPLTYSLKRLSPPGERFQCIRFIHSQSEICAEVSPSGRLE